MESTATQKLDYPLPAYNFRVTVDGESISFAEVTGLAVEYKTLTYRHGLSFLEGERIAKYRYEDYAAVTFRKGVVHGRPFLAEWVRDPRARQVEVSLCDETGSPVVTWRIARAIAVKLEAPSFAADSNEASVEMLEIRAAGVSVEHQ